jgi:hypothetical protein
MTIVIICKIFLANISRRGHNFFLQVKRLIFIYIIKKNRSLALENRLFGGYYENCIDR